MKDIRDKQDRNNPYDPEAEENLYDHYRAGWYLGYVSFYIVSIIVGNQAKTAIKGTKTFKKLADKFDRSRLGKAKRYLDDVKGRTGGAAKKTTFKLGKRVAKGSRWLGKRSARRILSGARTASRKVSLSKRMRKIEGHKIDDLSRSQESKLRTLLARTGDDGVEAINDLDSDTVDDLLDLRPSCTGGTVTRGHGWKYIAETTGLATYEIEQVLQNQPTVPARSNSGF